MFSPLLLQIMFDTRHHGYCPNCECMQFGRKIGHAEATYCDDCQDDEANYRRQHHTLITREDILAGTVDFWCDISGSARYLLHQKEPQFCDEVWQLAEIAEEGWQQQQDGFRAAGCL